MRMKMVEQLPWHLFHNEAKLALSSGLDIGSSHPTPVVMTNPIVMLPILFCLPTFRLPRTKHFF